MITDDVGEPVEAIPVDTAAPNPLVTGLAWLAVVVVVLLVGYWVWTRWIDPSVGGTIDRYVHKDAGVVFEDPVTAQFSVTMPSAYKRSVTTNELGTTVTVSDTLGDYAFSVTKSPQPPSALDSYTSVLNTLAGQMAKDAGAGIESQTKPVPIIDVAVKSVVYQRGNTWWRARLELLQDRLYTIVAKTPGSDDAPYQRLAESFKILGPHRAGA